MLTETLLLLKNVRKPNYKGSFKEYLAADGYKAWQAVLKGVAGADIINKVKESGLRGRGGAGFPTGLKWSFMAKGTGKPSYLVCNADEGEPGTFKDREIMLKDPHMFLEGMMIGCYALGCNNGYIYVRGEYSEPYERLSHEIEVLKQEKLLGNDILGSGFSLNLILHPGAGAYICGEETALLDSLEGKRGLPRVKPPFPAVSGFDQSPTSVNNVETLANIPGIILNGPESFSKYGTPNNAGTRLICLSGHVKNPGIYEVAMGVNLKSIIYDIGGGTGTKHQIKAVIPGGSSSPVFTPAEIDIAYDFDSIAKAGSLAGSGAIIVLDESVNLPKFVLRLIEFYAHESCGQCTPCREGMNWLRIMLREVVQGKLPEDGLEQIIRVCHNIAGNTLCAFGDAGAMPVVSFITKFREEFISHCTKSEIKEIKVG